VTQNIPDINAPVFSIITPTFRRPDLLRRTIQSLINQSFRTYEHIIVDDACDRETENLINEIGDKRIIFIQHASPKGAAGGYNTGIKISRGRFILFLDDDDEYLPSFLEKMDSFFSQAGENIGFAWAGISRIQDTHNGEIVLFSRIWPARFPEKESGLVAATSIGNGFGLCVRKECIDTTGLYDESLRIGEDTDFLFRLVKHFDFETIPEVLVKIHQHGPSQLTDRINYQLRLDLKEEILNRHLDLLKLYPGLYYAHYKSVVDLCYILKLKKKGRKNMIGILKNTPFRIRNLADLISYEVTGKAMVDFYYGSILRSIVRFFKKIVTIFKTRH
jgi:glycosyltransferase involved in cell wall biosynthesis